MLTKDNNKQKTHSLQPHHHSTSYHGPSKLGCFLLFRTCWKNEAPSDIKEQRPLLQQATAPADDNDARDSKGCCIL